MSRILSIAGGGDLLRGVADVVRRHELALLDVDDAAGAAGRDQQIGLAAKKRRDLQDVRDLGCRLRLRGLVDIGEDRDSRAAFTPARMRRPSLSPGPR